MVFQRLLTFQNKIMSFMNSTVEKSPFLVHVFFVFFDFSSLIIRTLLFDLRFFVPLCVLGFSLPLVFMEEWFSCLRYIALHGFHKEAIYYAVLNNLNIPLQIFICVYFFLFQLVVINTYLSQLECVKQKMIEKYNDIDIIKKRKFNSPLYSLFRLGSFTTAAGVGLGAGTYILTHEQRTLLEAYRMHIEGTTQHNATEGDLARFEKRKPIYKDYVTLDQFKGSYTSTSGKFQVGTQIFGVQRSSSPK
jgi:hypothetical protein